jgi:hypothetical protein
MYHVTFWDDFIDTMENKEVGFVQNLPMLYQNAEYSTLTPWSRNLLEMLTVTQIIKKFLASYAV